MIPESQALPHYLPQKDTTYPALHWEIPALLQSDFLPDPRLSNLSCPLEIVFDESGQTVSLQFEEPCYINLSAWLSRAIGYYPTLNLTPEHPLVAANRTLADPITSPLLQSGADIPILQFDEESQASYFIIGPQSTDGDDDVSIVFQIDPSNSEHALVMVTQPDGQHTIFSFDPWLLYRFKEEYSSLPPDYVKPIDYLKGIKKIIDIFQIMPTSVTCLTGVAMVYLSALTLNIYNNLSINGLYDQVEKRTRVKLTPKATPNNDQLNNIVKELAIELGLTPEKLNVGVKSGKWTETLVKMNMKQLEISKLLLKNSIPMNIEFIIRYVLNHRVLDTLVRIRHINRHGYEEQSDSIVRTQYFLRSRNHSQD